MNIRNAQIDDVNRVSELMLQVAKIHSSARRDIFKEKNIEEIKNEVNNRMNNKENILIAEENNCNAVELNCWNFNRQAIKFYEECGMNTQRLIMEVKIN